MESDPYMPADKSDPSPRPAGQTSDAAPAPLTPVPLQGAVWPHRVVILALVLVFGGVYLATLHPGVDDNDRAEMQNVIPLLGLAHPPGYSIMMVVGKLFSSLPIPGTIAYRLNLLEAVCAVISMVLLYSTVRRMTRQVLPGVVAAGVLGFSSIYWQSALVAEVYIFYGMFLLLGIYLLVRHIETGRAAPLLLAALSLGVCCWNRPSELFVMPAFVLLWLGSFRRFKLGVGRVLGALALFVLPLVFSVGYFLVRYHEDAVYIRDDIQRDKIRHQYEPMEGFANFTNGLRYTLGLKWKGYSEERHTPDRYRLDRDKLLWLLSGRNALDPNKFAQYPSTAGVSVGLPAIVLGLLGIVFYIRKPGWWLLGLGLIAGNTAFYFYHVPSNNLDFITPGIIGFAILAGLGVAAWGRPGRRQPVLWVFQAACLAAPLFLLWANYAEVNRNTPAQRARQAYVNKLAKAELPKDAVILAMRQSAMVYRYLFQVQAGRPDVSVINENRMQNWPALARYYREQGRPVFVKAMTGESADPHDARMPGDPLPGGLRRGLRKPPGNLGQFGFYEWP